MFVALDAVAVVDEDAVVKVGALEDSIGTIGSRFSAVEVDVVVLMEVLLAEARLRLFDDVVYLGMDDCAVLSDVDDDCFLKDEGRPKVSGSSGTVDD